jgi:ketol-acid reductoisomerase
VRVVVGADLTRPSAARAREDNFEVCAIADAAARADVVALLLPDEAQGPIHDADVAPHIREGAAVLVAHAFSVRFGYVRPPAHADVLLVAPVGPGTELRARYAVGEGIPAYVGVWRDATGNAKSTCLAYADAIGCLRAGAFETTLEAEAEVDLFGEQAVLCGGLSALVLGAFDTLVEAGYDPEMAYLECTHQVALLAQLVRDHGVDGMRDRISRTALYGDLTRGPRVVGGASRAAMREILAEITAGAFAREWMDASATGALREAVNRARAHPMHAVGARLRAHARGERA